MKCKKHKGYVNMTPVEFSEDDCPHCKVEVLREALEYVAPTLTGVNRRKVYKALKETA